MMAFWRVYQNKPASFYADLVIDQGTRQQYLCNFIPNSFKTNEVNGNLYRVNAQLEVVQNQPNLTADIALIKDWEVWWITNMPNSFSIEKLMFINWNVLSYHILLYEYIPNSP